MTQAWVQAVRSQSPSRLNPNTVSMMAKPGQRDTHQARMMISTAVSHHQAPSGRGPAQTNSQEAQTGLKQDDESNLKSRQHDDGIVVARDSVGMEQESVKGKILA